MQNLKFRPTTARGVSCGEQHPRALHSDAAVASARAMRASGQTFREIAQALAAPLSTVEAWCARRRRTVLPVRVVVTRARAQLSGVLK